jgi:hypothetical protein
MSSPPAESRNGGQPGARRESASKGDPATGASIGSSSAPPVAGAFVPPTLDTLRRIVDLAESGSFYLILDPAAGTLTLNLRGVVVRTWYPSHIEIGTPRVLFFERGDGTPADLAGSLWTGGRLDPPRTEERTRLEVDSQGTPQGPEPEAEGIPPTPEEAVPAPWRYAIRFEGGLLVEVVSNQASEAKDGLATAGGDGAMGARVRSRLSAVGSAISQRWTESGAAARTGGSLRHRLRIVLPPGDSGGLYRGIPLTADLVIAAHQAARSLP